MFGIILSALAGRSSPAASRQGKVESHLFGRNGLQGGRGELHPFLSARRPPSGSPRSPYALPRDPTIPRRPRIGPGDPNGSLAVSATSTFSELSPILRWLSEPSSQFANRLFNWIWRRQTALEEAWERGLELLGSYIVSTAVREKFMDAKIAAEEGLLAQLVDLPHQHPTGPPTMSTGESATSATSSAFERLGASLKANGLFPGHFRAEDWNHNVSRTVPRRPHLPIGRTRGPRHPFLQDLCSSSDYGSLRGFERPLVTAPRL
ncbi:hypothetical protein EHS25_004803 [Saitozyma podzolica]|uniref:Uncharacterized protein n=1 Tax=Saitozyma podzolica TaxID=1890683 RepID=A0A427Y2V1_9TREE|nr:hypothetical protein EHS25_004803 [Saitozyma podzolica]